ncbi:MAG TPA: D-alanyl-D-alanine carboxypeptidase family protein [Pyrinomonadaceae bacterium]|nr:D-alanyl-D-alanine carboxypeptidase family protein [Pyrinomonadaceae bacterium]
MKRFKILIIAVVLVGFVAGGLFTMRTSRGQSQATKSELLFAQRATAGAPTASSRGPAASRNAALRNELSWAFGSKTQRGWYLYVPLISRLINTHHEAHTDGFAKALEGWQKKKRLAANGILDSTTLYAMVSEWQGRRLKDKTPATPDQLLTAPKSDFYDPTRPDELRQVERETYAAYKRMVAAAIADPSLRLSSARGELAPSERYLKIVSSFRSREYQDKLRRESPNAGSAGLAVNSPHFSGRALDVYVGGEPVDTNDRNRAIQVQTPVYQWLVRNAERFGFRPYYYEPWHWEYVGSK